MNQLNRSESRKGFEVHSPVGPVWFVAFDKVVEDYAEFLCDADGLAPDKARAQARGCSKDDICAWFYEQFSWHEVERHGQLVEPAKRTLISRSVRAKMRKCPPQHDTREIGLAQG